MLSSVLMSSIIGCVSPVSVEEDNSDTISPASDYPVLPELDETIRGVMNTDKIPGIAACIVKSGEVIWCQGYGYADIEMERAVTPSTPFMLASVSKTITGVALMHLIETGAVGLDEAINDYFSFDVNHPTDQTAITARMLLSHTSGIDDNWSAMNSVIVDGDSPISLFDFMKGYLTSEGEWYDSTHNFLASGIESEWHYSNIGVALAGYLVEAVSQISFSDYCQTHIFMPLGMSKTAWFLSELNEEEVAVPYLRNDEDWEPITHYGYPDYPDGALRTGAESLATFLAMFANGGVYGDTEILSAQSVTEMKRIQYPLLSDTQGLIWYSWNSGGEVFFGHGGNDMGVATRIGFRDDGIGFVILMNAAERDGTLNRVEYALLEYADTL